MIASEFRAEPCIGAAETVALELVYKPGYILAGRRGVLSGEKLLAHQFLIDQALGCFTAGFRTLVERLMIQETRDTQIAFDVTGFYDAPADNHGDAVYYHGAAEEASHNQQRNGPVIHQKVCPIEKKN